MYSVVGKWDTTYQAAFGTYKKDSINYGVAHGKYKLQRIDSEEIKKK